MVACSPALAELTSVNDEALSGVTGANGITIEMSSLVSVGQIQFDSSGSFQVDDVVVGGAGVTSSGASEGFGQYFDQLTMAIDILEDGVLQVGMRPIPSGISGEPGAIDWGISTGAIGLVTADGKSALIADGLEAWGRILSADYQIGPSLDVAGYDSQRALVAFTIEDLDLTAGSNGLSVQNLQVTGTESGGVLMGGDALSAFYSNETNLSADEISRSVSGAEQGFAILNSSVGAEPVAVNGALQELKTIRVDAMAADISIENMAVGGTSLGAAHLDNLRVSDTVIRFNGY